MNKQLEKFAIPLSILIGCIIIGGFIFTVQMRKQNYIEEQASLERFNEIKKETGLNLCLDTAESDYWSSMELNGTKNKETGVITAPTWRWEDAEKVKQNDINNCYKQYK